MIAHVSIPFFPLADITHHSGRRMLLKSSTSFYLYLLILGIHALYNLPLVWG